MEGLYGKRELKRDGQLAVALVKPGGGWIHRVVQKTTNVAPDYAKTKVSIDFTVPEDFEGNWAPITFLPKWPPLTDFDFRDQDDKPVPLLTSKQNQHLDRALFRALLDSIDPALLQCAAVKEAVKTITSRAPNDTQVALDSLADHLRPIASRDENVKFAVELGSLLAGCSFLCVPIAEKDRGRRQIYSLSYTTWTDNAAGVLTRIVRSMAWYEPPEYLPLIHMGKDSNFHLSVQAPPSLKMRELVPKFFAVGDSLGEDEDAEVTFTAYVSEVPGSTRRPINALYVSGERPLVADVGIRLAVSRSQVIAPAIVASTLIACLTTVCALAHNTFDHEDAIEPVVTVLTVVPALISILLASQLRETFVRWKALGVQLVSMASGLVPLIMALLLIRCSVDPEDEPAIGLSTAWELCATISWVLVGLLLITQVPAVLRRLGRFGSWLAKPFRRGKVQAGA
jgi:hypothetical protein